MTIVETNRTSAEALIAEVPAASGILLGRLPGGVFVDLVEAVFVEFAAVVMTKPVGLVVVVPVELLWEV